jgi:N utilization substance protein A
VKNEFELAFNEIAEQRVLPPETVLEALETALISAYRRDSNASAAQRVEAQVDPDTGRAKIFVEKEVVDDVMNRNTEVDLEKARYYEPEAQLGDTVMVQVEGTTKKFGRIAAQTAKQVILQKIREAERNSLYEEYIEKEGDIVHGTVQSVNSNFVTLSLGRAEAIMPRAQQIRGERYRPHDKIRCYVWEVKRSSRGPQIVVSRSHRNMLRRLLEFEVPEIYNGQIEIKNIAREAGQRSKVAVSALQEGIDPVGACVGMRGIRIQNIVKELHEEKIDVIEWNPKQEAFIEKALSPARVAGVYLDDDPDAGRTAVVIVPDDQLSLAIGREGQNARLAAKLTGWRIDIKSVTEAVSYALDHLDQEPLADLMVSHPALLEQVASIMDKKAANLTVMPEDYRVLNEFAALAEQRLQAARDEARQARLAEINAVKMTLPQHAFDISVQDLDLPDHMIEALQPLENVGEIMLRFLIDENRLRRMLSGNSDSALQQLQTALDKVMTPDEDDALADVETPPEAVAEAPPEPEVEAPSEAVEVEEPTAEAEAEAEVEVEVEEPVAAEPETIEDDEVEAAEDSSPATAFPEQPMVSQSTERASQGVQQPERESSVPDRANEDNAEYDIEDMLEDEEYDESQPSKSKGKRRKERQKRRQLIYDEKAGRTVAKRRRKGSRKRDEWEDLDF